MSDNPVLNVVERASFGKGSARKARAKGLIPAVIYGHGTDPVHVELPYHETFLIVKDAANAVITLKGLEKDHMVLVKDVQRHPVKRNLMHLDLLLVKADEKVEVEVPIEMVGEPASGTTAMQEMLTIAVTAPVINLPETITVDVEGLEEGTTLTVADLKLPSGVTTAIDPEFAVLSVVIPQEEVLEEETSAEEGEEAEAEAAASEE